MPPLRTGAAVESERITPLVLLCGFALVACLALGGGTHGGFISDAVLELATLPVLLLVFWRAREEALPTPMRGALLFCAALASVPLLQLLPLPPALWTALPGRAPVADAYGLGAGQLPWTAFSMAPIATGQAALSLIPAVAVFSGTLLLNSRERRHMSLAVLAIGLVSVFLGLAQLAQGPASPLRFFAITSNDVAVGFFANRNHYACALCATVVFGSAWAAAAVAAAIKPKRAGKIDTSPYVALLLAVTTMLVLIVGVLASRSRAGLVLLLLALASGLVLAPWRKIGGTGKTTVRVALGAAVLGLVAIVVLAQLSLIETMQRFAENTVPSDRLLFARNTAKIALALLPFGAGVGAFVPVYAMFESPADVQVRSFTNHAHNDLVETALETGFVGPLLLVVFAIWFARAAVRIWRRPYFQGRDADRALARAATIVLALVALHSLVDYPLRTGAVMALVAFACGLMFEPIHAPAESVNVYGAESESSGRHRRRRSSRGPSSAEGPRPLRL